MFEFFYNLFLIIMFSCNLIYIECAFGKMISLEVMELFTALESNHPQEVEEVKHKFHEQFNNSK